MSWPLMELSLETFKMMALSFLNGVVGSVHYYILPKIFVEALSGAWYTQLSVEKLILEISVRKALLLL